MTKILNYAMNRVPTFLLILLFAGGIFSATAQTPIISHKSHAGSANTYLIASSSNFGDNPNLRQPWQEPLIIHTNETFIPLNDSTIVLEILDLNQNLLKRDTLLNKEKYSPMVFEFRYKDSIRKKEMEKMEENEKRELEEAEQLRRQQEESQQQLNEPAVPAKKKKKSYILFLFGITGGGILLMKLFGRSRIVKPSIL